MSLEPKARELLIKSRVYRVLGLVFAVVGLAVFFVTFMRHVEGAFFSSLTNPFVVTMIIFPFLPAAVLSFLAGRLDREYMKKYAPPETEK